MYGLPGAIIVLSRNPFLDADILLYLEYYRQVPPQVPHFIKTLFRRKLVLWCGTLYCACSRTDFRERFLASEILRDYWLSGVCSLKASHMWTGPNRVH